MRNREQDRHRIRLGGEAVPARSRKRGAGGGGAGPVAGEAGLGFGGLLRQLRDEAGLTQEELAEAARVSRRAVSDLEGGSTAPPARTPRCYWPARWGWTGERASCSWRRPADKRRQVRL